MGAEVRETAWEAYKALTKLLMDLRVETSKEKVIPPTTRLEFLGVTFDSTSMTMEISEARLKELKEELATWLLKSSARCREVESIVGKLQFVARCVKAGQIFLGRMITWIWSTDRNASYGIPIEAQKDIA